MASIPLFLRRKKDNLVFLNELKRYVAPWQLTPQNIGNRGILPVLLLTAQPCVFTPDQNGPFEGMYLTCELANQLMMVRINDAAYSRDLMNRDVLATTIMTPLAGGQNPFVLPESLWLEQRHNLIATFTDFSGAANTARPVVHGRKFWLRQARAGLADRFLQQRRTQRKITTPYFYTTDQAVTLAAAAAGIRAPITITEEGHFVAYKITCWSDGPFEFKLLDGETGIAISGTVFISNLQGTGTAANPYVLPEPWFVEKSRQLILEMNNFNALSANRIFFTVSGRRVFDDSYREIV